MTSLLTKLQSAKEGSRELDALIWCRLRGFKFHSMENEHRLAYHPAEGAPRCWGHTIVRDEMLTRDLGAGVAHIEKMHPHAQWMLSTAEGGGYVFDLSLSGAPGAGPTVEHNDKCLALCISLLRAMGE